MTVDSFKVSKNMEDIALKRKFTPLKNNQKDGSDSSVTVIG